MAPPEAHTVDERPVKGAPSRLGYSSGASTAYDADRPDPPPGANTLHHLIGRRIDHFEIRALLGQGGMGAVYLAHDLSLERPVAIKVLRSELAHNQDLVARLVMEARAQARLQHQNVVNVYYIGLYENAPYFAMEYVRGRTLADLLTEHGTLPWADALDFVIQTARALMEAKQRGIVHRDIKPSNLILADTGASEPRQIKVADFGLAAPPGFREERFVGSPFYASPEQMEGLAPDHRSDIYSLGVTFHELLTGRPPFQADSLREISKLHHLAPRPPIPERQAPWKLRQLVKEMMDPEPTKRPWSYEELLQRLELLRPRPVAAGGLVARGMAIGIDLALFGLVSQLLAGMFLLSQRVAHQTSFALFGLYTVLSHRYFARTLGKRLFGLRLQGTTRAMTTPSLALRFLVAFWGPITALVMISLQVGALPTTTDLAAVKDHLQGLVGVEALPVIDAGTNPVLRTLLVPNLILAIPWLGGFVAALFDENRQALHDRVARTRVVYSMREMAETSGV
jgi:uncharacterized RDD family membrane protein YckC